jgi:hypothetical protein
MSIKGQSKHQQGGRLTRQRECHAATERGNDSGREPNKPSSLLVLLLEETRYILKVPGSSFWHRKRAQGTNRSKLLAAAGPINV